MTFSTTEQNPPPYDEPGSGILLLRFLIFSLFYAIMKNSASPDDLCENMSSASAKRETLTSRAKRIIGRALDTPKEKSTPVKAESGGIASDNYRATYQLTFDSLEKGTTETARKQAPGTSLTSTKVRYSCLPSYE
jgi:hypothetical protein